MAAKILGVAYLQSSFIRLLNAANAGAIDSNGAPETVGVYWWVWQLYPGATDETRFQYALQHRDNGRYISQLDDNRNVAATGTTLTYSETWIIYQAPPKLSVLPAHVVGCKVRIQSVGSKGFLTTDKNGIVTTEICPAPTPKDWPGYWTFMKTCPSPIHPHTPTLRRGGRDAGARNLPENESPKLPRRRRGT